MLFYADDYYLSVCEQAVCESGATDQTIMHCIFVGPARVGNMHSKPDVGLDKKYQTWGYTVMHMHN